MSTSDQLSGVPIGSQAPAFSTEDIGGNAVNLKDFLQKYSAVLIDFFRGAW
ncbi:MAG: hypothetical protein ACOC44_18380 [Promethearchaeia archaeon]